MKINEKIVGGGVQKCTYQPQVQRARWLWLHSYFIMRKVVSKLDSLTRDYYS